MRNIVASEDVLGVPVGVAGRNAHISSCEHSRLELAPLLSCFKESGPKDRLRRLRLGGKISTSAHSMRPSTSHGNDSGDNANQPPKSTHC